MYSTQEIKEIRDIISRKREFSEQEINILRKKFENKEVPNYLWPFTALFVINPSLFKRISADERIKKYSLFGFFPETFDLIYGNEVSPEISFDGGNRGMIGIISHPTKKIVIKPVQNSREYEVAQIADELTVGPKQYKTLDGFLTEQFVEGSLFSGLNGEKKSFEHIYQLGRRSGEILSKLHSKNIFYNDTILTDDFGRSHLIVQETSPAILFDYGVALLLDKHPNLTNEDVFNFARTIPIVAMSLEISPSLEQAKAIVQRYRPAIQEATKEQIMLRDVDFIKEGLTFAVHRLGNKIVEPFSKGFKETYLT